VKGAVIRDRRRDEWSIGFETGPMFQMMEAGDGAYTARAHGRGVIGEGADFG
jgi:hypothetical protein